MKRFLIALCAVILLVGCQTTPKQDAELVNLATRLAKQAEPSLPTAKPFSLMPASLRSMDGGGGGGAALAAPPVQQIIGRDGDCITILINGQEVVRCLDPWKPAPKQVGLICDPDGIVRIDFTESLTTPIQWETWLYLTNWSAILICDKLGPKSGFYRVVRQD